MVVQLPSSLGWSICCSQWTLGTFVFQLYLWVLPNSWCFPVSLGLCWVFCCQLLPLDIRFLVSGIRTSPVWDIGHVPLVSWVFSGLVVYAVVHVAVPFRQDVVLCVLWFRPYRWITILGPLPFWRFHSLWLGMWLASLWGRKTLWGVQRGLGVSRTLPSIHLPLWFGCYCIPILCQISWRGCIPLVDQLLMGLVGTCFGFSLCTCLEGSNLGWVIVFHLLSSQRRSLLHTVAQKTVPMFGHLGKTDLA